MAIQQIDGQTNTPDKRPVVSFGTMGGDHLAQGTVAAHKINQNIYPADPRVQYFGGPSAGTWTFTVASQAGLFRFSSSAFCQTPGAQVAVTFSGTRIEVYGLVLESGGKFDCYIDGNLTLGVVSTTTYIPTNISSDEQVPPTSSNVIALNASSTTIPAADTSAFVATGGYIRIENEAIQYTSTDATNFYGCTRGALGTTPATHMAGSTIYALNSGVDTYSGRRSYRRRLWMADNLSSGTHQLILQIRPDKNSSSSGTQLNLDCFTAGGGLLGGAALNLYTRQLALGSGGNSQLTTDGSGNVNCGSMTNIINSVQLVGILGVMDDSHVLSHQVDNLGNLWVHGAASTTYTNCYVTLVYAGDNL